MFSPGSDDAVLGDDIIECHVMRFGVNFIDELEAVAYTDLYRPCFGEKSVIVAFAASYAVAAAVESHCRHDHHVYIRDIGRVIAARLLDSERAEV